MPLTALNPQTEISTESYGFLQRWIRNASGIVIDEGKGYLVESRLVPLLDAHGLSSLNDLCQGLRKGMPGLSRAVLEAMTTHETLFFRDVAAFEVIRTHILPQLMRLRGKGERLQLWSAAASSGQEAYSLAIMLLEAGLAPSEVSILGTDISEKVLQRAQQGLYRAFETGRGLPPTLLDRYFQRVGEQWQVKPHVRQMVRFEQLDLRQPLRNAGPFHLVLCRNVLIYFDAPTKGQILARVREQMVRGGYLMLGTAEALPAQMASFQRETVADAIPYRAD